MGDACAQGGLRHAPTINRRGALSHKFPYFTIVNILAIRSKSKDLSLVFMNSSSNQKFIIRLIIVTRVG